MDDRREDWNNSVEKRLVDLNSAQLSADAEQVKLRRRSDLHDLILRGDPVRNKEGLIEAVNSLKNEINKFNRMFDKDYLGHGGLVSFVTYVYEREREHEDAARERRGYKWAFWGLILAAVIGAAAVVVTNKEQIEKWWKQPHVEAAQKKVESSKHPRRRRKPVPAPEVSDDHADEGMP